MRKILPCEAWPTGVRMNEALLLCNNYVKASLDLRGIVCNMFRMRIMRLLLLYLCV